MSHRKTRGHDLPDECWFSLGNLKIVEKDRFAGRLSSHARRLVVEGSQTYLCNEQLDVDSGDHQAEHAVGMSCVRRTACGRAEMILSRVMPFFENRKCFFADHEEPLPTNFLGNAQRQTSLLPIHSLKNIADTTIVLSFGNMLNAI